VNVPETYPYEDFPGLYFEAWKVGAEGARDLSPNNIIGSVLSVGQESRPQDFVSSDRIAASEIKAVPRAGARVLRWPGRPNLAGGNPAWTYMIEPRTGSSRSSSGTWRRDRAHPFEAW